MTVESICSMKSATARMIGTRRFMGAGAEEVAEAGMGARIGEARILIAAG